MPSPSSLLHGLKRALNRLYRNLKTFFVLTWLDWVFLCGIGAEVGMVWHSAPRRYRLFPVNDLNGNVVWPSIAYPYRPPVFNAAAAGILSAVIPVTVFALSQVVNHSFADFATAILGLAYSMLTATCIQVIIKKLVGGLRPHFLAVCEPNLKLANTPREGFQNIMYTVDVCTGDPRRINNALESFPSGHAAIAFSGFGFLALYLAGHFLGRRGTDTAVSARIVLVLAPLVFATYLASTLVSGYHHHAHDVIFGGFIGMSMAMLAYWRLYIARGIENVNLKSRYALAHEKMMRRYERGLPTSTSTPVVRQI